MRFVPWLVLKLSLQLLTATHRQSDRMSFAHFLSILSAVGIIWIVNKLLRLGRRDEYLPPGPPTVPILGNAHQIPAKFAQFKFGEWARKYGGIYSLKLVNSTAVVVSDATVLKELLDQRSAETSGRPPLTLINLITGGYFLVDLSSTSDVWRIGRKALQRLLSRKGVNDSLPVVVAEGSQLLYDLLRTPQDFSTHIDRYNYSIMMCMSFGKRCLPFDKDHPPIFFKALRLSAKIVDEAPPIDEIPILKYVPEWWAPWKVGYKKVKAMQREVYFGLLEEAEARVARGESAGSFMEDVIQHREELGMSREAAAYLGAILLEAGSESTTSLLRSLILCFVAFPETLRKAQSEVDSLLPDGRPPTPDDIASLPYVHAILREVQRFRPVPPLGFPHTMLETQEYRGYVIPKGTTVLINVWGMMQDPEVFDEPNAFRPERFLLTEHGTKQGVDASDWRTSIPFGSGKRLCPGMHFALTNLTFTIATLVWAFDFAPAMDPVTKSPKPVDILAYKSGLAFDPLPFECSIIPRSEAKAKMITQRFIDATATLSKYEEYLTEEEKKSLAEERMNL